MSSIFDPRLGRLVTKPEVPEKIVERQFYSSGGVSSLSDLTTRTHNLLTGLDGDDHTQYALLIGRSGGQSLIGGTAASNNLSLESTSHATKGLILAKDTIESFPDDVTHSARTDHIDINNTYTEDFSNVVIGTAVRYRPTVVMKQAAFPFAMGFLFDAAATIKNDPTVAANFGPFIVLNSQVTLQADGQALTQGRQVDVLGQNVFSGINGGTLLLTSYDQFAATATVNAGATITTRRGLQIVNPSGAGVITTNIGVDIAIQTKGDTNIGLRNAATSVYTPVNQNITAVTATITATSTYKTLTANASYTLTSAPTIADGQDGQLLIITNEDTVDSITLQDQGTLASSNLRLGAATRQLDPRDSIILIFNSTIGDWVELSFNNVT